MRTSLLLALSLLLASLAQVALADFPLHIICASAPWPVRIQPAWETIINSITADVGGDRGVVTFRSGSLILYGGIHSNDIWISEAGARVGENWYLIGGIARDPSNGRELGRAREGYDLTSFEWRYGPAVCEDPLSDRAYLISGFQDDSTYLNDVWSTDNGRNWVWETRNEFPSRAWSSCSVNNNEYVLLLGGVDAPYHLRSGDYAEEFNDVWRSTSQGWSWTQQTIAAPWATRYETLMLTAEMPITKNDIIYVIGGKTDYHGLWSGYLNDIWVSSDDGVSWAMLNNKVPFAGRWGHSGVVTRDGIIVFFGGAVHDSYYQESEQPEAYWGDIWTSFDGGYTWTECSNGRNTYNRTEAAVTMDVQGYLMIAAGYSLRQPRSHSDAQNHIWNNDVVRSAFSLERDDEGNLDGGRRFAEVCGISYPANGPGLKVWPTATFNAKKGLIAGVSLVSVLFFVAIVGFFWVRYSVAKYGEWRWPTSTNAKQMTLATIPDWELFESVRNRLVAATAETTETSSSLQTSLLGDSNNGSEGQVSINMATVPTSSPQSVAA